MGELVAVHHSLKSPVSNGDNGAPRKIIRCPVCHLRQFVRSDDRCRKCFANLKPLLDDEEPLPSPPDQNMLIVRQFGKRLQTVRLARKMSRTALACSSGIPRSYIIRLERGDDTPGIAKVEKLAKALSVWEGIFFLPSLQFSAQCMALDQTLSRISRELMRRNLLQQKILIGQLKRAVAAVGAG